MALAIDNGTGDAVRGSGCNSAYSKVTEGSNAAHQVLLHELVVGNRVTLLPVLVAEVEFPLNAFSHSCWSARKRWWGSCLLPGLMPDLQRRRDFT